MNSELQKMNRRLRDGQSLDQQAASLCELMTSAPVALHESENFFNVSKLNDVSFTISAHRRHVRAEYSHVFVGDTEGDIQGRFEFKLLPVVDGDPAATAPLLTLIFDINGVSKIGSIEFMFVPVPFQRSAVRNLLVTHAIASLQYELRIDAQ